MFVIENEKIKVTLEELGAVVLGIYNKETKEEHFWQYDSAIWPRRTAVCFPICGALIDGEYTCGGQTYSLPMHGFLREMPGKLTLESKDHAYLSFSDTDQTRSQYPFSFDVKVDYQLSESSLTIKYIVKNTNKVTMPYSMGAHYTYKLPAAQKDCKYLFSAPQDAKSFSQENGRLLGFEEGSRFKGNRLEMNHLFDDSARIYRVQDLKTDYIAIGCGDGIFTKVEFSGFKYVVLWAPKGNDSPFACIEPWDGLADFLNHNKKIEDKKGINFLSPGEERTYIQKVTV